MQVFYLPDASQGLMNLPEEESKHCVKVLRMLAGESFCVTNGQGLLFDAILVEPHPKRAVIELSNPRKGYDHWCFKLEIAVAPTKNNDRIEWFLEKATEIGIDKIHFFESCHSERRTIKTERFEKVIIAAIKQSIKSRLPQIEELTSFEKLVKQPFDGRKFIAWIDDSIHTLLSSTYNKSENCLILIGPEGDFDKEEVQLAIDNGFEPISLGDARLRTETAALVACHTIQLINQLETTH